MKVDLTSLKERCLSDFYFFAKGVLEFGDMAIQPHKRLCDFLQSCYENKSTRIMVLMPRGWFKTTVCTVSYPLWLTLHNPNLRFLLVSEREDNAIHYLALIRQLLEKRPLLRALLGLTTHDLEEREMSRTKVTLPRPHVAKEGTFEVVGVGGTVVGRHYNYLIKDDIVGPESAHNPSLTEASLRWHKFSYSLLESPTRDVDVIVGVRWGRGDFYEHILNTHTYETFILSAYDSQGKSTFPSRFSEQALENIRQSQGAEIFGAQYKLECIDVENALFKREWLSHVSLEDTHSLYTCLAVDPALSTKATSDPTALVVVGKGRDTYYILDIQAKRLAPSELVAYITDLIAKWRPHRVVVEATAFQRLLARYLRHSCDERELDVNIIEFVPRKSKELRIRSLEPLFSSGHIKLACQSTQFEDQYLSYPKTSHDDILDALATCILHLPRERVDTDGVEEREPTSIFDSSDIELGRSVITGY